MLQCLHPPWPPAHCTLWCVDFSHITLLLAGGGEDSCHRAYYSDGSLCSTYELCNTRGFEYNSWQWQQCRNSALFIPGAGIQSEILQCRFVVRTRGAQPDQICFFLQMYMMKMTQNTRWGELIIGSMALLCFSHRVLWDIQREKIGWEDE